MKFVSLNGKYGDFKINYVLNCWPRASTSVGILGFLGLIAAIKFRRHIFSDHQNEPSSSWVVPGLKNFGNNCFLNAILQALASCSMFRKHLREILVEYGDEEVDEGMPLVSCLSMLVEELCTVHYERTVVSPRELMASLDLYIPSFDLARQQDAEEAFCYLLSSVREEISSKFSPHIKWLADLPRLKSDRCVAPRNIEEESDWQRWRCSFLKPFDGILCSILICKSCFLQVSQDYEIFSSLHLQLPLRNGGEIKSGCLLKECLKQLFIADRMENYHCCQCWHNAAISYLLKFSEEKADVEKVRRCDKSDACDCKTFSSLENFPWSNSFSYVYKQVSITRSPEILCLHLQRASCNMFGEPIKLVGHISFPLILDFSPFMGCGARIDYTERVSDNYHKQHAPLMQIGEPNYVESTSSKLEDGILAENESCSIGSKVKASSHPAPAKRQFYRLVSVVEHFGTGNSGHYIVYRRLTTGSGSQNPSALLESGTELWFCISDSDVVSVPEEDVRKANASLLFYEKIDSI